ncbi:hypothetical protein KAU43_07785 [candidate division WOR-3 bacterium]|nr:hypothetical protein [candidate division WOR-3 bacterium]
MGWKGESRRHSLSRKGIKTNIDPHTRFAVNDFVARGKIDYFKESGRHSLARKGIRTDDPDGELAKTEREIFEIITEKNVARGKNNKRLTKLTPKEERAWDFAWTFYEDEYPDDNERAEKIWEDLQLEFPRLRKFDGIALGSNEVSSNSLELANNVIDRWHSDPSNMKKLEPNYLKLAREIVKSKEVSSNSLELANNVIDRWHSDPSNMRKLEPNYLKLAREIVKLKE